MENFKKKYQNPEMAIIKFNNDDIILTSGTNQDPKDFDMGKIPL